MVLDGGVGKAVAMVGPVECSYALERFRPNGSEIAGLIARIERHWLEGHGIVVAGTIRYAERDFALSQSAFSQARPIPLWQGAVYIGCLGAMGGLGIAALLSKVLPMLSQHTAWGAVCGAILLPSAGAWRLSTKLSPMHRASLQLQQAFRLDDDGFRLSTETAETHMKWTHFLAARIDPDLIVLKTRDETIVLLRRDFLANQADWDEAKRLVSAHVSEGDDGQPGSRPSG